MNRLVVPNNILLGQASELLAKGIEVILMTKGNSMLPFIRGEVDSVRMKKMDTLSVGDVVLAEIAPGKYVLHRIILIDGDHVTLMGDGNLVGTELCLESSIVGTALEVIRPDGTKKMLNKAVLWRKLLPFRRYLLWVYRRLFLRNKQK